MNDLVFVMYNSKLMEKQQHVRKVIDCGIDDVSSDDEWIVENDENSSNNEGLDLDGGDSVHDLEVGNEDDLHDVQVGEVASNVASASKDYLDLDLEDNDDEIEGEEEEEDIDNDDEMEDENMDGFDINELLKH